MNSAFYPLLTLVLFLIAWGYFRLARQYGILDQPNHRSLHQEPTIRGGGILFPVAVALYFVLDQPNNWGFLLGLLAIAMVGFFDDLRNLSRIVRFGVQALAMALVFYELQVIAHTGWLALLLWIVAIGTVNAYNFMDGINGMTAGYTLVALLSLLYIDAFVVDFVTDRLVWVMVTAVCVFGFFNFRKKAVCFAGDVGSLSMGFAVIYLILKLIMVSHQYAYILLLAVYGVDSVLTIVHRLLLRQNIFQAHKLHLYQVIISARQTPHLPMATAYLLVQLLFNALLIYTGTHHHEAFNTVGLLMLVGLGAGYLLLKTWILKSAGNVV